MKFKKGDKIRVTADVAKDESFHSDLEADLLGDSYGDSKINNIMARITEQQTLTITHIEERAGEIFYSTRPTVGCSLEEGQIETVPTA